MSISSVKPNLFTGVQADSICGKRADHAPTKTMQSTSEDVLSNVDGDTFVLSNPQNRPVMNSGYSQYAQGFGTDSISNVSDTAVVDVSIDTDTNTGYVQYAKWSGTDAGQNPPDLVGEIAAAYDPDSNTGVAEYTQWSGTDPQNSTTITGVVTISYDSDKQQTKV